MLKKKISIIPYSEKEIEVFRARWKTTEGKERRKRIIEIIKSGSTEFGGDAHFPELKDKISIQIPPGKDLRGINLSAVETPKGLNFSRFHLAGSILEAMDLSSTNFSFAHLEFTSFNGSTLNRVIFKGAHFVQPSFIGANMDMVILAEAIIDGYQIAPHRIFMEEGFREFATNFGFIDKKSGIYSVIKNKYKMLGKYDEMVPFHILEMRSKRDEKHISEKEEIINGQVKIKRRRTALWYLERFFFDICFGYGEKWYSVLTTALFIILLFSSLYSVAPLRSNWSSDISTSNWLNYLYFSAVNFTNLGSQDWLPGHPLHRVLMSIESVSGLFLTTLIIVIFTRKMIRD
jgi:hypothetical protein